MKIRNILEMTFSLAVIISFMNIYASIIILLVETEYLLLTNIFYDASIILSMIAGVVKIAGIKWLPEPKNEHPNKESKRRNK